MLQLLYLHQLLRGLAPLRKNVAHFIPALSKLLVLYLALDRHLIEVLVKFNHLPLEV